MFGASKAYAVDQVGCSGCPRPSYLIEDVYKGQSIVALQRHRGVHTLLRGQQFGEGIWELHGLYINGLELGEEGVLEC